MLTRLLFAMAAVLPLAAQDDVDKYLSEAPTTPPKAKPPRDLSGSVLLQALERSLQTAKTAAEQANSYALLAHVYGSIGRADEQRAMLLKAVEVRPDSEYYAALLAGSWLRAGERAKAFAAVGVDTADFADLLRRARSAIADPAREIALARELAERAQALRPDDLETAGLLAELRLRAGEYPQAISELRQLIRKAPAVCRYHGQLALALQQTQAIAEARQELELALACTPAGEERTSLEGFLEVLRERPAE